MSRHSSSIRFLVLGGILSTLLHAAIGLSLGGWSLRDLTQPTRPSGRPETSRPPEQRLGLEKSRNVTITWLGFEHASEHSAREATVDQAELTRDPAGEPAGSPAAPAPTPTTEPPPQSPVPPVVAAPAPPPAHIVEATAGAVAAAGEWLVRLPSEMVKLAAMVDPPSPQPPETASQESPPAAEASPELLPPEAAAPAGTPGQASQKESDATSIEQTLEVRPGQPAAAEGLEIDTIRPRWRYTTLLTAAPRNPTVQITFGRDGRVKRASFLVQDGKTLDSGYRDVDEPLLNAVYQWTAAGEALEALPEPQPNEDPDTAAGLTVTIRIILRG